MTSKLEQLKQYTTVVADTGAYITGLTLGKHPMAPRISPKKTWSGTAAGWIGAASSMS